MARVENNNWIVETVEEAQAIANLINNPAKINPKLQEALAKYKALTDPALESFNLFDEKDIPTVEEAIQNVASSSRLEKAIDRLRSMDYAQYSEFVEKHK